ncbi:hypothetical protein C6A85_88570 [Mycobacterium sp. ITM-2017-0098]|nr:hypothetical protein C6A85_88570 [Mycobacterium sp. ITM-2017-0098]
MTLGLLSSWDLVSESYGCRVVRETHGQKKLGGSMMQFFGGGSASVTMVRRLVILGVLFVVVLFWVLWDPPDRYDGGRSYRTGVETGRTSAADAVREGNTTHANACTTAQSALFVGHEAWEGFDAADFLRGCIAGLAEAGLR